MKAEILNLSASILLGKATPEQIKDVSDRARASGDLDFFKQEILDCDAIIRNHPLRKETK